MGFCGVTNTFITSSKLLFRANLKTYLSDRFPILSFIHKSIAVFILSQITSNIFHNPIKPLAPIPDSIIEAMVFIQWWRAMDVNKLAIY